MHLAMHPEKCLHVKFLAFMGQQRAPCCRGSWGSWVLNPDAEMIRKPLHQGGRSPIKSLAASSPHHSHCTTM
eukprot:1161866-Pelagomonas_calceolata.AAC.11